MNHAAMLPNLGKRRHREARSVVAIQMFGNIPGTGLLRRAAPRNDEVGRCSICPFAAGSRPYA
jgi:hypothetical protein